MVTPTPEQMRKLKHATGFERSVQIGMVPGWRTNFSGYDVDCEAMCELGWMKRYESQASDCDVIYHVTKSGMIIILAEWEKVTKFDVVTVIDEEDKPRQEHTTRVVAKTHAAARFKIARSIQDAWSCDFSEAVRHIKSVRKVKQ